LNEDTFFSSDQPMDDQNMAEMNDSEQQQTKLEEQDDNDEDSDVSSIGSLFGSDNDEEAKTAHGDNKILSKEYTRSVPEGKKQSVSTSFNSSMLPSSDSFEFAILRLPNVIGCDTEPFDENTYVEPSALHSASSIDNNIRWRTHYEPATDETFKESNTKLVVWKDGTKSLVIGKDCYDIDEQILTGNRDYLYTKLPNQSGPISYKLCHGPFVKRLNVRTSTHHQSYKTLQKNLAKKHERTKGSKQLTAAQRIGNRAYQQKKGKNGKHNKMKKRKINKKRNLNESWLEQGGHGDSDDDEDSYSPQRKKQRKHSSDYSDSEEEEESEEEEDDSDEEEDDQPIGDRFT